MTTTEHREIVAACASRLHHLHPNDNTTAEVLRAFDQAMTAHDAEVAAQERARVIELAARRADEGYRLGESCDDIARDIRALATPAEPDGSRAECTCPSGDGSLRWPCPTHPPTNREPDDREEGR